MRYEVFQKANLPTCSKSKSNIRVYYFSELRCLEVLLNTQGYFQVFYKCQSFHMYELWEANEGQGGINHFCPCVQHVYYQLSCICVVTSLSMRQRLYFSSFLRQTLNNSVLILDTLAVILLQIGHKAFVLYLSF